MRRRFRNTKRTRFQEQQRQRLDDLKRAMDDAKEQAEREKHERRMRKLEEGGHETARYHKNFEGELRRASGQGDKDVYIHTLLWC